jgi:4-hydroxy-3-polyprenylbenzoate decarboxylase
MKHPMPPLALPKREYMEGAKALWERLGLPPLQPESPWFGYSLGDWSDEWDRNAEQAARGGWMERDADYARRRNADAEPNSPVRQGGAPQR